MMRIILLSLILVGLVVNIVVTVLSRDTVTRRVWKAAGMLEDSLAAGSADLEQIKKDLLMPDAAMDYFRHTYPKLLDSVESCVVQRRTLDAIKDRLEDLLSAEIENQAKKGESNRTLKRRIAEYKLALDSLGQTLAKATQSRDNAVRMASLLHEELKETRKYMKDAHLPVEKLTRHLEEHFKGNIPGVLYDSALNELDLRKKISQPLVAKVIKHPDDAA